MPALQLKHIKKALRDTGARWKAAAKTKPYALGYKPGPKEQNLAARELTARANHQQFMAMAVMALLYPAVIDWRLRAGKNYVTPVKD
jgi:hypothetical protein